MRTQYFKVYGTINVANVRYSDDFGEELTAMSCPQCNLVKSHLSKCDAIEVRRSPPNVLVNWTSYPDLACQFPIVRDDLIDILAELSLLDGAQRIPLKLEDGSRVEGFQAFIPPAEMNQRGDGSATHAVCPQCHSLSYNPNDGGMIVAAEVAEKPMIAHERRWLLVFEKRLLDRLTPGQMSGLRTDEYKIVERPLDNLTKVLPLYPDAEWRRRYFDCGGYTLGVGESFKSSEMTSAME